MQQRTENDRIHYMAPISIASQTATSGSMYTNTLPSNVPFLLPELRQIMLVSSRIATLIEVFQLKRF
jgi:hypothetical protein